MTCLKNKSLVSTAYQKAKGVAKGVRGPRVHGLEHPYQKLFKSWPAKACGVGPLVAPSAS